MVFANLFPEHEGLKNIQSKQSIEKVLITCKRRLIINWFMIIPATASFQQILVN